MLNLLMFTAVAFGIYLVIDLIWMALVSKRLYRNEVGEILRERPNYFLCVLIYIFLAFGLVFFVTQRAITDVNIGYAILGGLVYGFIISSAYALTNLAKLKDWSALLSLVDITWVSFLTATTSLLTYLIYV